MGSVKSTEKKIALGAAIRKNKRVPLFVVAKTNRRVRENPHQRNWRKKKLKLHIK
ncbi:MAG: 50S ribosomal protein L39e [Candidatus Micrarchaeota archaeon]|nr:50S ribosomal protein L39e [Candidatus Micrarchaeota archaeon]